MCVLLPLLVGRNMNCWKRGVSWELNYITGRTFEWRRSWRRRWILGFCKMYKLYEKLWSVESLRAGNIYVWEFLAASVSKEDGRWKNCLCTLWAVLKVSTFEWSSDAENCGSILVVERDALWILPALTPVVCRFMQRADCFITNGEKMILTLQPTVMSCHITER